MPGARVPNALSYAEAYALPSFPEGKAYRVTMTDGVVYVVKTRGTGERWGAVIDGPALALAPAGRASFYAEQHARNVSLLKIVHGQRAEVAYVEVE